MCLCKICRSSTRLIGNKHGTLRGQPFQLRHCDECHFSFVANPWTDYADVYSEAYYEGRGADPTVDYVFELEHPDETVRQYEWNGIVTVVRQLQPLTSATRWLDFGCGNGGLVRYCIQRRIGDTMGYEEGHIASRAREQGIPIVNRDELEKLDGMFDIITAIEVMEHVEDPVLVLRRMHQLLRPGGLLFVTTGNARPYRHSFLKWSYVRPEVHLSYFEPGTLALAMEKAGLQPSFPGYVEGYTDIIRFKVLKTLGVRRHSRFEQLVPWGAMARIVDRRRGVSSQPCARKFP
jgi:SAM-dependent methyltransferase